LLLFFVCWFFGGFFSFFFMIIENCQMYIFAILSYHIYSLRRILLLFLVSDVSQLILLSPNIYRQNTFFWWVFLMNFHILSYFFIMRNRNWKQQHISLSRFL
jgi:hypothetical protein